jgi:glycosyltransferase involved in cell wall biosynthesis
MPDEIINRSNPAVPSAGWPIIVHCHLRWDFVWQRPQQLFSRLARRHRVLFLEEPAFEAVTAASLRIAEPYPNVVRVVPVLPIGVIEIEANCLTVLVLLRQALKEHQLLAGQFENPVEWFYSPMSAPYFQGKFDEIATVYDCMDELANFRFAPGDIANREKFLMARADVVFTGGFQLMQAKARLHHNVHFHGCGVDAAHYSKARQGFTAVPDEVVNLPRPVLGYFGVIDERLDYELIAKLATHFREGSIVMVGPVVKVDPLLLPRFPNLHWLGQRDYDDLPKLVKSFDVCLMPFAMNEATQFINPTKTLEYMAAGKPVVSTPVPDVVRSFDAIVAVARDAAQFIACAEYSYLTPDPERIQAGIAMAKQSSWEAIVVRMESEIDARIDEDAVEGAPLFS